MKNLGMKIVAMALLALPLMACEQEGPAERAGKRLDQAVENSKDALNDAVDRAGEEIEEAGDAIREKTDR